MRYTYKVRELNKDNVENMYAMSLKKLRGQLDHKEYAVEYTNKHNNFISTTLRGKSQNEDNMRIIYGSDTY